MECLIEILISDKLWFVLLQLLLILQFFFALYKDFGKDNFFIIKRGEESRSFIVTSAGAIITILISIIFQISNYPKDGKIFFYVIDLVMVSYLCFYSSYFTNKLVKIRNKFIEREL